MKSKNTRFWKGRFFILALLLIGAGLRLWDTGRTPPGLYHDEAQHGLDALHVLETGEIPLYFPANNGREPLFIYLVTASVALLGRSPLAVRLPSFFVGFLTLAAVYNLARTLWGRRAGTYALAVLALTFWHVHLSRVGFRAVLLPLCTALYLAQAARGLRTGHKRHWLAAGAIYGLSWYTYMAARFTPVALLVMVIYGWIFHREATRKALNGLLLFSIAALIVLAPLGVYTLIHPDIVLARTGQVTITHPEINGGNFWGTLLKHTLRTAGMFFVRGDRIWRHNLAWRPVWDPALGLAFIIGAGVALFRFRRDPGAALALLWTATLALPTLLAEDAPHFLRGVGVLPTAALLPALGLEWIRRQGASGKNHESRIMNRRIGEAASQRGGEAANRELRIADIMFHVSRFTFHVPRILPIILLALGGISTTYDYFVRFANAPLAFHWFEGGPVALAGEINALLGNGWDGEKMLHGPATGRPVYLEPQLWESWSAVPFLAPQETIRMLSDAGEAKGSSPSTFVVWPYRDWEPDVMPYLPHPAYLRVEEGPQAQGDKDERPFTIAMLVHADPRPAIPEPVARFEQDVTLRAALVRPQDSGAVVRLWWESGGPLPAGYTVFVHYLRDGAVVAQHDKQPGYGHLHTTAWRSGDLILDEHPFPGIVPDPARDTLRVGLYRADTMTGLRRRDAGGDWVEIGVIVTP
ncbi:MAG: glycosyltransferase family 39 protein [Anaerolineae bacterium]|nr:glycosyltransferase family 39 protein [Anaerolineae bacterium]